MGFEWKLQQLLLHKSINFLSFKTKNVCIVTCRIQGMLKQKNIGLYFFLSSCWCLKRNISKQFAGGGACSSE